MSMITNIRLVSVSFNPITKAMGIFPSIQSKTMLSSTQSSPQHSSPTLHPATLSRSTSNSNSTSSTSKNATHSSLSHLSSSISLSRGGIITRLPTLIVSGPQRRTPHENQNTTSRMPAINITPSALQIEQVRKNSGTREMLRLAVESGGCHGFQYKLEFTKTVEPDDFVLGVVEANATEEVLVVDEKSIDLVEGCTLDFTRELIGSSFKVIDNPQAAGKGCGCGVSWELKETSTP